MKRKWVTLVTILLLSCTLFACGQQRWNTFSGATRVAGGAVVSMDYQAPNDSGKVHIAYISPDSTLCYAGYQRKHFFPPKTDFMMRMRWGHCNGETNTDSTGVRYFGGTKDIMEHKEEKEPVTYGDLFLVTYQDSSNTTFRRVQTLQDLEGLPPASQQDLRAFIQDSLNWADQH